MPTWALHTELDLDGCNTHLAALEAAGLLGIVEEDGRATAWFRERVVGLPVAGVWERVDDLDWHARWRESIEPVVVGRVAVHPPWLDPPDVEVALAIEPAQAFGTGHHETTAGCLAELQRLELAGRSVLDVGTGTGVLAIAALRLGAARAVGVDVDPVAVATAEANAAAAGVALDVRAGSVEAAAGERFDVVVANLDTATLSTVAGGLAAALAEGGTLLASGVSLARVDEAVAALGSAGLAVEARPGEAWAVLVGGRA